MKMNKNSKDFLITAVFLVFVLASFVLGFAPGVDMGRNFLKFSWDMVLILPPAFVLIGLFDVWAKNETIEKQLGKTSGIKGYIWATLLAATTVGGVFVAFPVANALYHKGARIAILMTYLTSASLLMVPMTVMEASILGIRFTAVRLLVSLPLVFISSILIERFLGSSGYQLPLAEAGR